jgi:methylase of polypeptide subunit release factors
VSEKKPDESLKGWPAIAKFLSQPVSTVQRWATEGMPVTRIGRYVGATPAELENWLSREAGTKQTVHIPTENTDLLVDLKRGLSEVRKASRKSKSG